MRLTRLVAVLTAALAISLNARAELPDGYRVVLMTENFPPYNFANNGKNFARSENIEGIAADVVREMFSRAKIEYDLTLRFPWQRIYEMALEQPSYGVFVTARLPEREDAFKWVGPLGPDDWVMLAKRGSNIRLNRIEDAKQYRIGAYQGDAIAAFLSEKGLEPTTSLRDQENVRKLITGQIDLWATGDPAGRYLAREEGVTGLATVLRFNEAELFLAMNKNTPDEVIERLQSALDEMRKDGTTDRLSKPYLGE